MKTFQIPRDFGDKGAVRRLVSNFPDFFFPNFQTYFFFPILNLLFYCLTSLEKGKHARNAVYQISIFPYKLHGKLVKM